MRRNGSETRIRGELSCRPVLTVFEITVSPISGDRTMCTLNYFPSQLPSNPTDHENRSFPLLLSLSNEILKVCLETGGE